MPIPFPGMDPYLEAPEHWPSVHSSLIFLLFSELNARLPPGIVAAIEERVYLIPPKVAIPDISLSTGRAGGRDQHRSTGNSVLMEPETQHGVILALPLDVTERFIEIRSAELSRDIITIIEILSPSNKASGNEGRQAYLQKQSEVLRSHTNLLEIDLLRGGMHTVAAPNNLLRMRGSWDYIICLHRSEKCYEYEYWFNRQSDPLPNVKIPLTSDLEDYELDLQSAFNLAYDAGPYKRLVNYSEPPPVLLDEASAADVDHMLREKGLRP